MGRSPAATAAGDRPVEVAIVWRGDIDRGMPRFDRQGYRGTTTREDTVMAQEREHDPECIAPTETPASDCDQCAAIDHADETYRQEPPEMFAREWGTY